MGSDNVKRDKNTQWRWRFHFFLLVIQRVKNGRRRKEFFHADNCFHSQSYQLSGFSFSTLSFLSKFNRCLGISISCNIFCSCRFFRDFARVLKSTLFSLQTDFPGKVENMDPVSLFYWFFSRFANCHFRRLVQSAFNLIFCCAIAKKTERNFFWIYTIIYLFHKLKGTVYAFIIFTFSSLVASTIPLCSHFLRLVSADFCARLHRYIALINQWFIGYTFRHRQLFFSST